jgi:hypothetical protein
MNAPAASGDGPINGRPCATTIVRTAARGICRLTIATTLIEEDGKEFVVFWSPETAEHDPDYRELGRFPSREKALEFLSADG